MADRAMRTDLGDPTDDSAVAGLTLPGEPSPRERARERAVAKALARAPGAEDEDLAPVYGEGEPASDPRPRGHDDDAGDIGPAPRGDRHEDDLIDLDDEPPRRQQQQQQRRTDDEPDQWGGVPTHLVQAAEAMSWSPEEIQAHIQSVGAERAMADFGRFQRTLQEAPDPRDVLAQSGLGAYPAPGQQQPAPQGPPANGQTAGQHQAPGLPGSSQTLFSADDRQQLEEELGPRAAKLLIERMEAKYASAAAAAPGQHQQAAGGDQMAQVFHQLVHAHIDNLAREGHDSGKVEFYGQGDPGRLGRMQQHNRRELIERATAERILAERRGRPITPREALLKADSALTATLVANRTRAQIEGNITRRSRQITVPPDQPGGGRGRGVKLTPEQDFAQAVEKIHQDYGVAVPAH